MDMKENIQLSRKTEREGVFGYTKIRNSSLLIFKIIQPFIYPFQQHGLLRLNFCFQRHVEPKQKNRIAKNKRGIVRVQKNQCFTYNYD